MRVNKHFKLNYHRTIFLAFFIFDKKKIFGCWNRFLLACGYLIMIFQKIEVIERFMKIISGVAF